MDEMQDTPRLAFRQNGSPATSRLRWRVFVRSLAAMTGVGTLTVLVMLLVRGVSNSTVISGAAGLLAALLGSALVAALWSSTLDGRIRKLIRAIETVSPEEGHAIAHGFSDDLFEEVVPAWQRAIRTLQDKAQQENESARQSYETLTELMRMFAKAVDERAGYLLGHSERVAGYSAAIAWRMGLDEHQVERIRLAGILHDIGSLCVEDDVMLKQTPLTPEEFEVVKAHTIKGAAILRPISMLQDLIPGVELHHESLDGLGYPYGLKGNEIPVMARIIAVADSFDAMTTPRPYQAAMNADYVVEILRRLGGKRYDAAVVRALAELVRSGALETRNVRGPVSFRMRKPMAEAV